MPRKILIMHVIFLTLLACQVESPHATTPLVCPGLAPTLPQFTQQISPLLEKRCGDALCHGRPERPYALYAAGARRLDPATLWKAPLTGEEVKANYASTLGFLDNPYPRQTTLVLKAVGLLGHKGGSVFAAPSDPECQAVIAWMLGQEAP